MNALTVLIILEHFMLYLEIATGRISQPIKKENNMKIIQLIILVTFTPIANFLA